MCMKLSRFEVVWNHFSSASNWTHLDEIWYVVGVFGQKFWPEPRGFWNSRGVSGISSYSMGPGLHCASFRLSDASTFPLPLWPVSGR